MPQDRLRSPRGSRGRRLTSLTDFEFRVWDQYQLSADDFGVMRCSPLTIQAENDYMADKPAEDVSKALERLIEVGLVVAFEHQGRRYICQTDWQDFQKVEYPRRTLMPQPPADILSICEAKTQKLFKQYPGGKSKRKRKKGREEPEQLPESVPEQLPNHSGASAPPRETANANTNGLRQTANGHHRGAGVLAGELPRDHAKHAACDPTMSRCVPQAVHDKFASALAPQFGGDRQAAKDALQDWYPEVWKTLPAGFVMGEAFRFWQPRFDAKFASADAAPGPRKSEPRSNVPSAEETRRRYL